MSSEYIVLDESGLVSVKIIESSESDNVTRSGMESVSECAISAGFPSPCSLSTIMLNQYGFISILLLDSESIIMAATPPSLSLDELVGVLQRS